MEEGLRSAPALDRPRVHAETAEALQSAAEPALQLGNQLLDLAGRGADGTEVGGMAIQPAGDRHRHRGTRRQGTETEPRGYTAIGGICRQTYT